MMALDNGRRARKTGGFTLIEILVVILIVAIMVGLLAIRLQRDDRDVVRDAGEHLASLLQAAHDEAILRGSVLVFEMREDTYRFMQTDREGKFAAVTDGELALARLPEHVEASLEVENQESGKRRIVLFDPTGMTPPFHISLRLKNARWWIIGEPGGRIRAAPTLDEQKH